MPDRDRKGRRAGVLPSRQTGRADFPQPAFQSVGHLLALSSRPLRRHATFRSMPMTALLRYYGCLDSCRPGPPSARQHCCQQVSWIHGFQPSSHTVSNHPMSPKRATRQGELNRVHLGRSVTARVTVWLFVFGCLPPCLAATRLPSTTRRNIGVGRTSTSPTQICSPSHWSRRPCRLVA